MQTANDKRIGDQVIAGRLEFRGIIDGNVRVEAPGWLDMRGTIIGDVIVEDGATLIIRGKVRGAVHIQGGIVEIWGTVRSVDGTPFPFIAPSALVDNQS